MTENNAIILNKQFYQNNKNKNKNRKFLVFIFCIIAIIHSGFRNVNNLPEGNDTPNYQTIYERVSNISWNQLLTNFSFYSTDYGERDLGYPIIVKITQIICKDFTFFMFLTAAVFLIPFSILIYKLVKSYLGIILAFIIYFALYTNIVNSFMRQAVALGVILYGVHYIINDNWKKYYLLLLVAFVVHSSSIMAFPLYFLHKYVIPRKWLLIALFISPMLMSLTSLIIGNITVGTVYEHYGSGEQLTPIYYVFFLLIASLLTYIYYNRIIIVNHSYILIGSVMGSILLLPLIWMGGTVLRIGYYYTLFIIPLLPIIIDNVNYSKGLRKIIYVAGISFLFYYILK